LPVASGCVTVTARHGPYVFTLAHFSDVHLGYEAYSARSQSGFNQRGEDVVRALDRVVTDIIAADPPLVICSGDVAEMPHVPIRYMLAVGREFRRLTGLRADGSRRQLVVIAGNHDQSKHLRDGCFLDLFRDLPGAHIVTAGYRQITFDDTADPLLADVVVHAVPHDALRDLPDLGVAPVAGAVNVLTTHGVAESTDLFKRAVGREYIIPSDLLVQDWDYVALGHWHKQGPVFPLGMPTTRSKVWYAGSVETVGFGDARHGRLTSRGWLLVDVELGTHPTVRPMSHAVRSIATLPDVDATGMSPEGIVAAMEANIDASLQGAVVRQRVVNLSRDLWTLTDTSGLRQHTEGFLHYQIEPVFERSDGADGPADDQPRGLAAVASLLRSMCLEVVPEPDRDAVLELAFELVGQVASLPDEDDPAPAAPAPATDQRDEVPEPDLIESNEAATPMAVATPIAVSSTSDTPVVVDVVDVDPAGHAPQAPHIPPPLDDPASAFHALLGEFDGLDVMIGDPPTDSTPESEVK
jgi:DNA repair protein SbcD/Mre11